MHKILICRGNDPDIHADRRRIADSLEFLFLHYSKHTKLHPRRNITDFIQKNSPAVGLLKTTDSISVSTGKRTLHMSEKLTLKQAFRERRAVDLYKGLRAAHTHVMYCFSNQLFAGAAHAGDKDRCLDIRKVLDEREYLLHLFALPDNIMELTPLPKVSLKIMQSGFIPDNEDHAGKDPVPVQKRGSADCNNLGAPVFVFTLCPVRLIYLMLTN